MGDVVDAILEGVLCEQCAVYIDTEAMGFPRKCGDCKPYRRKQHGKNTRSKSKRQSS